MGSLENAAEASKSASDTSSEGGEGKSFDLSFDGSDSFGPLEISDEAVRAHEAATLEEKSIERNKRRTWDTVCRGRSSSKSNLVLDLNSEFQVDHSRGD